jgi:hypothetical protein
VVAIAGNNNVRWVAALTAGLRVEGVREPRSHVWDSEAKLVLEVGGNQVPGEIAGHPVGRESESVNCSLLVVFLVVVYHQLFNTVSVDVSIRNRISGANSSVNCSFCDQGTIFKGNSVEAHLLVEELGSKHNDLVFELGHLNDLNTDIRALRDDMFGPSC